VTMALGEVWVDKRRRALPSHVSLAMLMAPTSTHTHGANAKTTRGSLLWRSHPDLSTQPTTAYPKWKMLWFACWEKTWLRAGLNRGCLPRASMKFEFIFLGPVGALPWM